MYSRAHRINELLLCTIYSLNLYEIYIHHFQKENITPIGLGVIGLKQNNSSKVKLEVREARVKIYEVCVKESCSNFHSAKG